MRCVIGFIALALFCSLPAPIFGQGIIEDGNANFEWTGGANGIGNFEPNSDTDHVYQMWWFYRVEGATFESPFPWPPNDQNYAGNVATITESLASFDAVLVNTIFDGAGEAATLTSEMTVTNTTADPITLHLFNYLDADVGGSSTGESALLVSGDPTYMQAQDGTNLQYIRYRGEGSVAYQVTNFATLRGLLQDGAITNLDNSGLPFGPGDYTGGYQWTLDLLPGESTTICANYGVNTDAPECGPLPPADPDFIRGDFDGDGMFVGLIDALAALNFQFGSGDPPLCAEASDADGDGTFVGLIDALYMLAHQFQSGPPPPAPYPTCGQDPDPAGSLGCDVNACP